MEHHQNKIIMKNLVVFALIVLISISLQAQNTQKITLEDFLVKRSFQAQTVSGLRSMNDGEHYTTLENNSKIVKYSYKTGDEVDVIFDIFCS